METEIIETLAQWIADGDIHTEFMPMESEHSVMSAAIGASATGARVFTATSSQGLELMHEVMYIASGMRLPIVMANCSRGLSAPVNLMCDHNDFLGLRDCGWLMFHAQNNQEVLDSIVMAYKISENDKVLLPSVINLDGFVLSYTMEPLFLPSQKDVDSFLPKYNPTHVYFDVKKPMVQGVATMNPNDYMKFKEQQHAAMLNAEKRITDVCKEWKKLTGRQYNLVEKYLTDDAKYILVTQGSMSTSAKAEIDLMREKGEKIGLLRLRVIRPLPRLEILNALENAKGVAVVDKNLSPGLGGIMYSELNDNMYDLAERPVVSSFIMGLGGKPEELGQFSKIIDVLKKDVQKKKGAIRFV